MALHKPPTVKPAATEERVIRYHIDYSWWEKTGSDLRLFLRSHLCPMHQQLFAEFEGEDQVDWIDQQTAEVRRVDGLEHTLHAHCSRETGYITPNTSLVNAVFRVFLANANQPLTAAELAARIGRSVDTVQGALSGRTIYKGIVPLAEEDDVLGSQ